MKQNCSDIVNISLFFDGTGNNKEVDEPLKRWSNPARLWRATQTVLEIGGAHNYAIYVSGVGTPFNEKATDWMHEWGDSGGGLVFGAGGSRRMDYGDKNVNDALRQALLLNAKNLNVSLKPYVENGKVASLGELAKALQGHRLISMINLSIFGFSRGAALARAFSNDIVKKFVVGEDGVTTYQGFPVRLHFMGLFDTVASIGLPSRTVDFPFDEKNLVVPQLVERCVHYVAANELRFSFPVDLIRKGGKLKSNWTEVAYPGVHSDVGGGYEPVNQGISNNYARIPMRDMLREAVRNGVRMMAYEDLKKASAVIFKERYEVKPETEDAYKKYVAAVGVPATVEQAMVTHMQAWYSAMGTMTRRKMKTPDRIEAESREGISKQVGHPGVAFEAEMLLGEGADKTYAERTGIKLPEALVEIGGARYRMMVRAEKWRLDAWQKTAPDPVLEFMKSYVHDSKAGFIMSMEPFSYFRPRGMAESTRNVLAQGKDWLCDTATAIKNGVIKVYHRAEGVVVETYEEGKLIATSTYKVGEKFVVDTAKAGVKYSVELYQSGKKVLISAMKRGEQMIITSIDVAKKEANAMADALQKKATEAGRQIQSGASQAAKSAGEAVDAGVKTVEDAWRAAQSAFGY